MFRINLIVVGYVLKAKTSVRGGVGKVKLAENWLSLLSNNLKCSEYFIRILFGIIQ